MTESPIDTPLWVQALLDTSLSAVEYRVLSYLLWRQGGNGHAWPSQQRIATDLHISERYVRDVTDRLRDQGWIEIINPKKRGRGHGLRYAVKVQRRNPSSSLSPSEGGTPVPGLQAKGGTVVPVKGGTPVPTNTIQGTHTHKKSAKQATKPKTTKPPFTPPTVDEVAAYATSRGHPEFDADYFVEHYTTAEWRDVVGNPVGNWKGKVLTWLRRDQERRKAKGEPERDGYAEFGTHPATIEEAEAALRDS